MMKNRKINLFLAAILVFSFTSCTSDLPKDPLLIPPKFDELPDQKAVKTEKKKRVIESESEEDIQELKDLLLD